MKRFYTVTVTAEEYETLRRIVGLFMLDEERSDNDFTDDWEPKVIEALAESQEVNLTEFLGEHYSTPNAKRVAAILTKHGWVKKTVKREGKLRIYWQRTDPTLARIRDLLNGCPPEAQLTIGEVLSSLDLVPGPENCVRAHGAFKSEGWRSPGALVTPQDVDRLWIKPA